MELSSVIAGWQTKLLQLDRRNSLLYFRGRRSAVFITGTTPDELFERLQRAKGGLAFPYTERRRNSRRQQELFERADQLEDMFVPGDLQTDLDPSPLQSRLLHLYRKAREWEDEQGVNVLFVALGFLNWINEDGESGSSPLLLAPAKLERNSPRDPWRLLLDDDDLQINETLHYKLHTLGMELPDFDHETPSSYFCAVNAAIDRDSWGTTPEIVLATFPFGKMAMWEDLESMRVEGIDHPVVKALAGAVDCLRPDHERISEGLPRSGELIDGGLDDLLPVKDQYTVLPADHSQLHAIELVRRGSHVVIHGPPGTGKSQTITNIIATLLADGKRVLFVSEKTAALDVVKRRLEECNLGAFCLDLHSDRARKFSVYAQLKETLDAPRGNQESFPLERLEGQRKQLNAVVRALHETRVPLGRSIFDIHGRYARIRHLERVGFPIRAIERLTEADLEYIVQITARIARRSKEFYSHHTSPWRALRHQPWRTELPDDIRQLSTRKRDALRDYQRKLTAAAEWLGVDSPSSLTDVALLISLATHMTTASGVPMQWLNEDVLRRLREQVSYLVELQSDRIAFAKEVSPKLGSEFPQLDYAHLATVLSIAAPERVKLKVVFGEGWELELCSGLQQAADRLTIAIAAIKRLQTALAALCEGSLAEVAPVDFPEARSFAVALREALSVPQAPAGWIYANGVKTARYVLAAARAASPVICTSEAELFARFDESLLEITSQEMLIRFRTDHQRFFRILTQTYRSDMRALRGCLIHPRALSLAEGLCAVEAALHVRALRFQWSDQRELYTNTLGDWFSDHQTDWSSIEKALDLVEIQITGWRWAPEALCPLLSDAEYRAALQPRVTELENALRACQSLELLSDLSDRTPQFALAVLQLGEALEVVGRLWEAGQALWPELREPATQWDGFLKLLRSAARLQGIQMEEADLDPGLRTDFGQHYDGPKTNWTSTLQALDGTQRLLNYVSGHVSPELARHCVSPQSPDQYDARAGDLETASRMTLLQVCELNVDFDPTKLGWQGWEVIPFDEIDSWLTWIHENADSVGAWIEYTNAEQALNDLVGDGVLDALRSATDDATLVPDLVLRRIYAAWLDAQYAADDRLNFQPRDHEALRDEFRQLDLRFVTANRARVRQRVFAAYPDENGTTFQYGQLGILNHQLSLKRRQLPVRRLIEKIPKLLQALKPCFLMSPIAVSQYLPRSGLVVDTMEFDAVVFDEASQVFPQDAVPAIARARQVVVVGDEQQLPPTSFFRADVDDDDTDDEVEDRLEGVESILDAMVGMVGTGVHESDLRIHYRSRHEDLIRYSNHYFYEDRLLTFPSPQRAATWLGVSDIYLPDARYDAGGTRTNRAEAEEVVMRVFEIMRVRPLSESVGVVALSRAQADRIEQLINMYRLNDSSLDSRFSADLRERFFVKNLENVQGDERDHIILSIGYGPTVGSGAVPNRFGPINREGGERRLNVAVSRARRSLTLVRSLRPDQIRSEAVGARFLRHFIEYAQAPDKAFEVSLETNSNAAETESPFEEAVLRAIERRGHRVARQVGCFGYRIDLAILSEDGTCFDLGIECDGATYHSSPAARDRDWLRQQVLEGLGWTIHRIWSTDWIKNPETQIVEIEEALEVARLRTEKLVVDGKALPTPYHQEELPDKALPCEPVVVAEESLRGNGPDVIGQLGVIPYEVVEIEDQSQRMTVFEEPVSRLSQLVVHIVEVEGPVHEDRVVDIVRNVYGVSRVGQRIRNTVRTAIREGVRSGFVARCTTHGKSPDHLGAFLDIPDRPRRIPPRGPSLEGWVRPIEYIWPGEIEQALLCLVESAYGIDHQEAVIVTARSFGFARVGSTIRDAVEVVLLRLIAEDEIQHTSAGLTRGRSEESN